MKALRENGRRSRTAWLALVGIAYFLAHHLSFIFPDSAGVLMAIWPPAGIALAAALVTPRREWPVLFAVLFVSGNLADVVAGRSWQACLGFMTANLLETAGCAWLIQRTCGGRPSFRRVREVVALAAATVFVNGCTALLGAGVALLVGGATYWTFWKTWWSSDGLGLLLVTPALIAWTDRSESRPRRPFRWAAELGAFLTLWCLVGWRALDIPSAHSSDFAHPYVLLALLAWPALRMGLREISLALLVLTVVALSSNGVRVGPVIWGGGDLTHRLFLAQLFLGVTALVGMLQAAAHTELKAATTRAREEETRIRALGDNLPNGMVYQVVRELDGSRRFLHVSAGIERLHGLTAEAVLKDPDRLYGLMVPEDLERVAVAEAESADKLTTFDVIVRFRHADGRFKWRQLSSHPRRLPDGRTVWDGIETDITGPKLTEAALRESETRFRRLFEDSPIGIAIIGPPHELVLANERFRAQIGLGEKEIVERGLRSLVHPDDLPRIVAKVRQLRAGEIDHAHYEERHMRADGSFVECEIHLTAIRDPSGELLNIIAWVQDVSDRKRVEAERAKLQEQLAHAQKMESVGRLAGGVSHDFNNMLGVILGHVDLAMSEFPATHPVQANLEGIQAAAQRSARLTRQLLAFARRQPIASKAIDLNEAVGGLIKMLQRLVGENVKLTWRPGDDLWPVKMDPAQVDQILANLCVNARDAIADIGTISIFTDNATINSKECSEHSEAKAGDFVRLTVSDDGCGMDSATLERIFEPYFTTKGIGKGTGLGLATVYGTVRQSGGFVLVKSAVGEGSCFSIHLPRYTGSLDETPREKSSSARHLMGSETILLVEDEPDLLRLTTRMLEKQGYRVLPAGTPDEAIRLARLHKENIKVLLTDVVMPEMNGRELASLIASMQPAIKSLFMSGYTADILVQHMPLDGSVHLISKPFSADDLDKKIREILG